jgi:hypothetical protein
VRELNLRNFYSWVREHYLFFCNLFTSE